MYKINKEGIIGIAIYLACDKMKKTKRKKKILDERMVQKKEYIFPS